uniref:NADH-ubiquinone oxidoreductase chain 5 n=1 Tax=Carios vespertilionis TaxID=870211 RepID=A0A8B0R8W4_9ACAR|nr:NADH dehydrogenase subunit 5 [Carios vespertilionis]QTW91418.1 NADH dehydrogenase subunit 5 [Carios vespertilionis]QTW91431.1 NADH dehydrogenase subunit 5 [Carios vespertilionis]
MFLKWGLFLFMWSVLFMLFGLWCLVNLSIYLIEYILMNINNIEIKIFFFFDWMSLLFLSVVLLISAFVIFYCHDYMEMEKLKNYFCYGVLFFVASMMMMIVSPNLLMILLGWDGLGLVSYVLVIYYQNYSSDKAGMITVLSNRIGDVMILLSVVFLANFGGFDFFLLDKMFFVSGGFLIIAGMTKSAQIPFSAWLPAAMAAPTPVSSLVHSSTLVTAGVYLLIRLDVLFSFFFFSNALLYISLLTMLMSGLGALFEMDLKSIIALSTLSQLGLMMLILSVGGSILSFYHLLTHAIFKAMLFLCAGFMIHSSLSFQDIRYLGWFYKTNPVVGVCFSLANLALFGMPFLSGFYSKDLILEFIYLNELSFLVIFLLIFATISTCLYSLRVMYYSMWMGTSKLLIFNYYWLSWMELPIFLMGLIVIMFGSLLGWLIFPNFDLIIVLGGVKLVNLLIVLVGCWGFYIQYSGKEFIGMKVLFNFFLSNMWFMTSFSSEVFLKGLSGSWMFMNLDVSWHEEVGPQGLWKVNVLLARLIQWVQMIGLNNYILFMIFMIGYLFI